MRGESGWLPESASIPVPSRSSAYSVSEHGQAMHDGPDEPGHFQGVLGAHDRVPLQRGERVEQGLERAGRFGKQFRIARLRVDETTEHHAIVRRVGRRKAHIGSAHRLKRRASAATFLPGGDQIVPQRAKPFRGNGRQQRPLVIEVPVHRGSRNAKPRADFAQGHPVDAFGADGGERLIEKRAAKVAVMVGAGRLTGRARPSGHRPHHTGWVLTASTLCSIHMLTVTT
jgi:hypothetical protein